MAKKSNKPGSKPTTPKASKKESSSSKQNTPSTETKPSEEVEQVKAPEQQQEEVKQEEAPEQQQEEVKQEEAAEQKQEEVKQEEAAEQQQEEVKQEEAAEQQQEEVKQEEAAEQQQNDEDEITNQAIAEAEAELKAAKKALKKRKKATHSDGTPRSTVKAEAAVNKAQVALDALKAKKAEAEEQQKQTAESDKESDASDDDTANIENNKENKENKENIETAKQTVESDKGNNADGAESEKESDKGSNAGDDDTANIENNKEKENIETAKQTVESDKGNNADDGAESEKESDKGSNAGDDDTANTASDTEEENIETAIAEAEAQLKAAEKALKKRKKATNSDGKPKSTGKAKAAVKTAQAALDALKAKKAEAEQQKQAVESDSDSDEESDADNTANNAGDTSDSGNASSGNETDVSEAAVSEVHKPQQETAVDIAAELKLFVETQLDFLRQSVVLEPTDTAAHDLAKAELATSKQKLKRRKEKLEEYKNDECEQKKVEHQQEKVERTTREVAKDQKAFDKTLKVSQACIDDGASQDAKEGSHYISRAKVAELIANLTASGKGFAASENETLADFETNIYSVVDWMTVASKNQDDIQKTADLMSQRELMASQDSTVEDAPVTIAKILYFLRGILKQGLAFSAGGADIERSDSYTAQIAKRTEKASSKSGSSSRAFHIPGFGHKPKKLVTLDINKFNGQAEGSKYAKSSDASVAKEVDADYRNMHALFEMLKAYESCGATDTAEYKGLQQFMLAHLSKIEADNADIAQLDAELGEGLVDIIVNHAYIAHRNSQASLKVDLQTTGRDFYGDIFIEAALRDDRAGFLYTDEGQFINGEGEVVTDRSFEQSKAEKFYTPKVYKQANFVEVESETAGKKAKKKKVTTKVSGASTSVLADRLLSVEDMALYVRLAAITEMYRKHPRSIRQEYTPGFEKRPVPVSGKNDAKTRWTAGDISAEALEAALASNGYSEEEAKQFSTAKSLGLTNLKVAGNDVVSVLYNSKGFKLDLFVWNALFRAAQDVMRKEEVGKTTVHHDAVTEEKEVEEEYTSKKTNRTKTRTVKREVVIKEAYDEEVPIMSQAGISTSEFLRRAKLIIDYVQNGGRNQSEIKAALEDIFGTPTKDGIHVDLQLFIFRDLNLLLDEPGMKKAVQPMIHKLQEAVAALSQQPSIISDKDREAVAGMGFVGTQEAKATQPVEEAENNGDLADETGSEKDATDHGTGDEASSDESVSKRDVDGEPAGSNNGDDSDNEQDVSETEVQTNKADEESAELLKQQQEEAQRKAEEEAKKEEEEKARKRKARREKRKAEKQAEKQAAENAQEKEQGADSSNETKSNKDVATSKHLDPTNNEKSKEKAKDVSSSKKKKKRSEEQNNAPKSATSSSSNKKGSK